MESSKIEPDFLWATGIALIISGYVMFFICIVACNYRWSLLPVERREQARFFLELLSLAEERAEALLELAHTGHHAHEVSHHHLHLELS